MTIIPEGAHEEVSITGTAFSRIPLTGQPECTGLLVADDAPAVARIEDGALVIDVNDLDLALAWRNAWQQACSHLIEHKRRREERAEVKRTCGHCGQPIRHAGGLWWRHVATDNVECRPNERGTTVAEPAPDDGLTTTAARREQDREGRS